MPMHNPAGADLLQACTVFAGQLLPGWKSVRQFKPECFVNISVTRKQYACKLWKGD